MALVDYGSGSDDEMPSAPAVFAAPDVSLEDPMLLRQSLIKPTDLSITHNMTYEQLSAPEAGPLNPFLGTDSANRKRKNVPTGYAEQSGISDATFRAQHRTFDSLGYAAVGEGFVGDQEAAMRHQGKDVVQLRPSKKESEAIRRKRQKKGDAAVLDGEGAYLGPWAKYNEAAMATRDDEEGEEYEEEEEEEEVTAPVSNPIIDKAGREYLDVNTGGVGKETTEFHGTEMYDYQGRTYMHVPQDLDVDLKKEVGSTTNFIPKKLVHTWKGHTKPITALRFFPQSGHLLLSSASDSKIKIWDVYHQRELLRTYNGHSKAVTDITFTPTGEHFLSASYDRYMKLWDTETGHCLHRFTTGKIPHVIRFNPSHPHEFLAGMSDKKIVQFDTRTEQMVQEYDHHLGPVNTITFVDEDRRFITTSDDKSLRAWEYGIPVPIKFIAEPYMYSMVRAAAHPSGKYVAYQSGDNQVVVYAATDKFRQNRKKAFRGHNNAGYAIDIDISPDGQFLMSGDSGGWLCFWDWKSCKLYHKFQASDGPVVAAQWHPQETSKVASAGLDCVIKYWD
ncbi:WD40-repeat-containing domain protein [Sphaerosporella brunnea]|uniref:WD40-repeat-containing domain protein n=1 Tax=Sphaerosporella brunnea TaxID=1250544 RepID=A0A5J5F1K3_9PEZI|nr:WD40-repeat-containing domain protein [Sphaerosporella brunnea]